MTPSTPAATSQVTTRNDTQPAASSTSPVSTQPNPSPAKTNGKKGRAGASNYNKDDITAFLDLVQEVEPIGSNMWALVASKYQEWSTANSRPPRDHDSFKNKFDKLCNAKKKTGDPSCPPDVRRAKHIACDIQSKIAAMVFTDGDDDDMDISNGSSDTAGTEGKKNEEDFVGQQGKRRRIGTGGNKNKKQNSEDILVDHVGAMKGFIGIIAKSFQSTSSPTSSDEAPASVLDEAVKRELSQAKQEVTEGLQEIRAVVHSMKAFLVQLSEKLGNNGPTGNLQ